MSDDIERLDDAEYHDLIETVAADHLGIDLVMDRAKRGTKREEGGKTWVVMGNLDLESEVLWMKQLMVEALPQHFSTWESQGHERIASQGKYRIIGKIPKDEVLRVLVDKGYLKRDG